MTEIDNKHVIFVGGKPFMNYVTAVVMQFTTRGAESVVVKSRGKFISRAVDVAEVVRSRFLKDQVKISDIQMDSEEFKNKEGRLVRVSTLDITISQSREVKETPNDTTAAPEVKTVPKVAEEPAPVEEHSPVDPVSEPEVPTEIPTEIPTDISETASEPVQEKPVENTEEPVPKQLPSEA